MTSESTRFLGQPNETKPTVGAVGWEDLLTVLLYREWDLGARGRGLARTEGETLKRLGLVADVKLFTFPPSTFNVLINPVDLRAGQFQFRPVFPISKLRVGDEHIYKLSELYNVAMQRTVESDAADRDFFQRLRRELEHEISTYVYEQPASGIGSPLSPEYIRNQLNAMRLCLVDPNWEEVNICSTLKESISGVGVRRMCVTMAEDREYVLVFDPIDEEYHLAWRIERGLCTWGIRGDGVECFIAR